jgi:hypothetical protein
MSCQSSSFISEQLSIVSDHVYDCVHWSTWSEWSWIRLCSLKYLEWVIMYTIVFTGVPGVSDHEYDCVHWSTHDHSLQVLQWTQSYNTVGSQYKHPFLHHWCHANPQALYQNNCRFIVLYRLCSLKYLEWVIMNTIVFTEVPGVSDHVYDCVHWSTWSEWSCIRLCSLKFTHSLTPGTSVNTIVYMITHSRYFSEHNRIHDHSLQVLQWTQSYALSLTSGTSVNTIVYMITHFRYFSEHNRIHDHSLQALQWTQSYTWSLTPGTSVNTIV